jgi:thioester reductase-like protein
MIVLEKGDFKSMSHHYFVTGATGAVGSALIPLLLEDKNNIIWIVIRGESDHQVKMRLDELISFWEMSQVQAEDARLRVIPLKGDTDLPMFDLPEAVYTKVVRECTHIIHCAGVVRMNLPIEEARKHAVMATENIVNLALACKAAGNPIKKIEFVSTVGVGGCLPGVLQETWISTPRKYHNTYEQSKAEAEDYLKEQMELHQLPITVHRPSMVVGDTHTGKIIHFQVFYHICEFLSGRRSFGLLPTFGDMRLDTVPVNYVAEVLRWSSLQTNSSGKILHICSGAKDAITLTELQKLVREKMIQNKTSLPSLKSLPVSLFSLLLKFVSLFMNEKSKRALKTVPVFLDYLKDYQGFDNQKTKHYLENSGGPKLSDKNIYLLAVINNYLKKT